MIRGYIFLQNHLSDIWSYCYHHFSSMQLDHKFSTIAQFYATETAIVLHYNSRLFLSPFTPLLHSQHVCMKLRNSLPLGA